MVSRVVRFALSVLWAFSLVAPGARAEGGSASTPARSVAPSTPEVGPSGSDAPSPTEPVSAALAAPYPLVHHAPPSVAAAHVALEVPAEIDFPHLVRRAVLVYRPLPAFGYPEVTAFSEVEFLRGAPGPYLATVPAEAVRAPGLEYAIELEFVDGRKVAAFASRQVPARVVVSEDLMDVREHAALERLGGRRSVVSTFLEYVAFGRSKATTASSGPTDVSDSYYRVEGAYTYRPLRTVDEFSIHVGVVRGHSPVPGKAAGDDAVGLNYAAPSLKLRMADAWRIEGELLTSVTEVGFSVGAGGAIDVGDPYGSKLRMGFESVKTFGTRFFSQVDIQASDRIRLSPIIEATDMPHAGRYGVRLIGEISYDFGQGLFGAVRGGYQARDATSGGPSAGIRLGWAF